MSDRICDQCGTEMVDEGFGLVAYQCDCYSLDDPTEPDEDDYQTSDHLAFYQYGKLVVQLEPDTEDWRPAIRGHMDSSQFWPDVWFISDHGNAHRMNLDGDNA